MKMRVLLRYLQNCFLLIVPALVLDLLYASRLPDEWQFDVFWRDIPPALTFGERITSLVVNILPVFMPLRISTLRRRQGLVVYIVGFLAYCAAWVMMVYFPQSPWSTSLIGDSLYFPIPYSSWMYISISVILLLSTPCTR